MAQARTTSVEGRLVIHFTQALQGIELPEDAIKQHLKQAALSHRYLEEFLRTDPRLINAEAFRQALHGQFLATETLRFEDGDILKRVRSIGGQFTNARMTTVPGGETFESQRDADVIKFWTDWHFKPEEVQRLKVSSSIASQVIYLPNLVEGSLNCTYTQVEGRKSVEEIRASLPKVEGLLWIVGNAPTVNRVLANHLKEFDEYLLPGVWTWTTDEYELPDGTRRRLIVGDFSGIGVGVNRLPPGRSYGGTGLFVLGVPS